MKPFWDRVKVGAPDECWPYTGTRDRQGYGRYVAGGRSVAAHRQAWEQATGQTIPSGMYALHSCDNPPCCNPSHLRPGTAKDNRLDVLLHGREPDRKGEANANARLTQSDVIDIRSLFAFGATRAALAEAFDVSYPTVVKLIAGETWRGS